MVYKFLNSLTSALKGLSAACLTAMMALTVADIIGRVIGRPLLGAVEITGFLATLLLAFVMPYGHREKVHIGVDILTRKLRGATAAAVEAATGAVSTVLFGFLARQSYLYAQTLQQSGERSMTLQWPTHVFVYALAVSFAVLTLVQLADVVRNGRLAVGR